MAAFHTVIKSFRVSKDISCFPKEISRASKDALRFPKEIICVSKDILCLWGNPTFPKGTFLTLEDGEPNDLHNTTDGIELHKSFDHHGSQTNTSIQWSSSRYKFSKERQKTWKILTNKHFTDSWKSVPGYLWKIVRNHCK